MSAPANDCLVSVSDSDSLLTFVNGTKPVLLVSVNRLASGSLRGLARGHVRALLLPSEVPTALEVDFDTDLKVATIFLIQGEFLKSFGIDGKHRTKNPAVISARHQRPSLAMV
jgi:hypothetical protein